MGVGSIVAGILIAFFIIVVIILIVVSVGLNALKPLPHPTEHCDSYQVAAGKTEEQCRAERERKYSN
jgi:hypothetical protein